MINVMLTVLILVGYYYMADTFVITIVRIICYYCYRSRRPLFSEGDHPKFSVLSNGLPIIIPTAGASRLRSLGGRRLKSTAWAAGSGNVYRKTQAEQHRVRQHRVIHCHC